MNWLKYLEGKSIPDSIQHFQQVMKNLSELNKKMGLVGCYQNHAEMEWVHPSGNYGSY